MLNDSRLLCKNVIRLGNCKFKILKNILICVFVESVYNDTFHSSVYILNPSLQKIKPVLFYYGETLQFIGFLCAL